MLLVCPLLKKESQAETQIILEKRKWETTFDLFSIKTYFLIQNFSDLKTVFKTISNQSLSKAGVDRANGTPVISSVGLYAKRGSTCKNWLNLTRFGKMWPKFLATNLIVLEVKSVSDTKISIRHALFY